MIALICVIPGCIDPKTWLEFWNGSKWCQEAKFHIRGDSINVTVRGVSFFDQLTFKEYRLGFDGTMVCDSNMDQVEVFPDSIEVWLDTISLQIHKINRNTAYQKGSRRIHIWDVSIKCDPSEVLETAREQGRLDELRFKLYFGHAFRYEGKPVIDDTIVARDLKADYYSRFWQDRHPAIHK
jgi:hypothetical protein